MGCGPSTPAAADAAGAGGAGGSPSRPTAAEKSAAGVDIVRVKSNPVGVNWPPLGPVFSQFDVSGDGFLQIDELKRAFRAIGLEKRAGEKFELDQKTFDAFDTNKDGMVSLEEFENNIHPKTREAIAKQLTAGWKFDEEKWAASKERHSKINMAKVYKQFDTDNDGVLDIRELQRAFRAIGLKKRDGTKMEVDLEMFNSFDTNKDGKVSLAEFEANLKDKTRAAIEAQLNAGWVFDDAKWAASIDRHAADGSAAVPAAEHAIVPAAKPVAEPAAEPAADTAVLSPEERYNKEMAAATILDEAQGYRDDGGFEHGHTLLKEKIAADKEAWAALNAKAVVPEEGASFSFGLIADQDEASKVDDGGETYWHSKLALGKLVFSGGGYTLALDSEATLKCTRGDKSGRGAEYSALEVFDGKLMTMDDRTGNVDIIALAPEGSEEQYVTEPLVDSTGKSVALYLGDGSKEKGLKCEWTSLKDGKLIVGSTGKARTDDDSLVVHHGEMWYKTIDPETYTVTNVEGVAAFNGLCEAAKVPGAPAVGGKSEGFMIHESGRWSEVHGRWFFCPRKLSREGYEEKSEGFKCVNLMIASPPGELPPGGPAPETEGPYGASCLVQPYLGFLPMRGCSDFMFVPGTQDCHILVLRTEESMDGVINSFASAMDLQGTVLMAEQKLTEDRKFEGCCWLGGWGGF